MSAILFVSLVLAAQPAEGNAAAQDSLNRPASSAPTTGAAPAAVVEPEAARSGKELEAAVRDALRRWLKPADADAHLAAKEFLILYREILQDKKLGAATREELRRKVRNRLADLAGQITKRIARESRLAKGPKKLETPEGKGGPMAQMGMGGGGAGRGGAAGMAMGMGGGGMGGPGMMTIPDNGQELVDLIQSTIAPASWDVHGGPGSIYYWRSQRALIVRQTGDIHEEIGGVLEQLERMNR